MDRIPANSLFRAGLCWRGVAAILALAASGLPAAEPREIVIDFEAAEIGKPVPAWTEKGVVFTLASAPVHSKAAGRVMFFPYLPTERKGILNAMANEQAIPVKVTFPAPVSAVTLVMFASTDSAARVEAHDKNDKVLDTVILEKVPARLDPGDPEPSFEITVKGENIAYVLFGGARNGDFVAAEEIRYLPIAAATGAANAAGEGKKDSAATTAATRP